MGVSFLTPWGAAVAALAVGVLAALAVSERRSRRLCRVLGLAPRRLGAVALDAGGIVAVAVLLGLAAAQPVVSEVQRAEGRTDAEVIAVLDVTRSMLARPTRTGEARIDRARRLAKELRAGLSDVPVGVASLTDRLLPHLFPTLSGNAFAATVDRAVEIERPPPERRSSRATSFAALGDLRRLNFYGPSLRSRVALVFTDGETLPFNLGELRALLIKGQVTMFFVHVWGAEERVYGPRGDAESYRPDPRSVAVLDRLARELGGRVFGERETGAGLAAVRGRIGAGPTAPAGQELRAVPLAPWAVAAAFLPLAFLVRRRNF